MQPFTADTYQNEYLADGASDVHAVVRVTGQSGDVADSVRTLHAAEVIVVDVSGSMGQPRVKLTSAKAATSVAIDRIRDGVAFGIIAGTHLARFVYPSSGGLVAASDATRSEAKAAVSKLRAGGGTAIGSWLMAAHDWLMPHEGAIRHVMLLTDGKNEGETTQHFISALAWCEGVFQADCRGVGTDWQVRELREIATRLKGTVDIVAEPRALPTDFDRIMRMALSKWSAEVRLRVWTPRGASVKFLKQVAPELVDLTPSVQPLDDHTVEFSTGAWGDESRDYHLNISVIPGAIGDEMLAAQVGLVVDERGVSQARVRAIWTEDVAASTRINPEVAHYTGQADLAVAIASGLAARRDGDLSAATARLGRAAQLAFQSENVEMLRLIARLVEVDDAESGSVRLKDRIDEVDEMTIDVRSTKTVRVRRDV